MKFITALMLALMSNSALAADCQKYSSDYKCTPPPFSSGYPTVMNGDGSIIGKAMSIGKTRWHKDYVMYADVRLEYDGHGFLLRFYGDSKVGIGIDGIKGRGYWVDSGCNGYPQYLGRDELNPKTTFDSPGLVPFISEYFTVIDVFDIYSEPHHDFTDVSPFLAHIEPYNFEQMNLYGYSYVVSVGGWRCTQVTLTPDRYTMYSLSDIVDITSQFSAPITFVPD